MEELSLGFSPCPNDTYIFHALVHGLVKTSIPFAKPVLEDVETLNLWAMQAKLDVTKLSFHALGYVLDDYCVLNSGSALGRGCGPLVVAAEAIDLDKADDLRVAIPGRYTTAAMLFQMYAPRFKNLVEMRFEQIMTSVANRDVDVGVIIHESRFTYAQEGLVCLADLGHWWEETSGLPIPLGCIGARRSLGSTVINEIDEAIRHSLEMAFADPQACLDYVRKYSQEIDQKVVQDHIGLYVNDFSLDLGEEGQRAVEVFLKRGREIGVLPMSTSRIFV